MVLLSLVGTQAAGLTTAPDSVAAAGYPSPSSGDKVNHNNPPRSGIWVFPGRPHSGFVLNRRKHSPKAFVRSVRVSVTSTGDEPQRCQPIDGQVAEVLGRQRLKRMTFESHHWIDFVYTVKASVAVLVEGKREPGQVTLGFDVENDHRVNTGHLWIYIGGRSLRPCRTNLNAAHPIASGR